MSNYIAVDIDDSLYSFNQLAQEMMSKIAVVMMSKVFQAGAYSTWNEWRTPNDMLDEEWQTIIDMCHEPDVIRSQVPFNNAAECLRRIHNHGHDLIYISNRSENAHDATYDWLVANDFPQAKSLICTTDNKKPYIEHCQYIIDDRPKTLVEFVYDYEWKNNSPYDRIGFGLFCEYNRALTDVPGIYLAPNWTLLEKYIEEKSDLIYGRNKASIGSSV